MLGSSAELHGRNTRGKGGDAAGPDRGGRSGVGTGIVGLAALITTDGGRGGGCLCPGLLHSVALGRRTICDRLGILLGIASIAWDGGLGSTKLAAGRGVATGGYVKGTSGISPLLLAALLFIGGLGSALRRWGRLVLVALGMLGIGRCVAILLLWVLAVAVVWGRHDGFCESTRRTA